MGRKVELIEYGSKQDEYMLRACATIHNPKEERRAMDELQELGFTVLEPDKKTVTGFYRNNANEVLNKMEKLSSRGWINIMR